ncbi:hypothetical protein HGRIS_002272 [Hohenbuehelia grisea]|uniref:Altered inheritance of mitochondria protein 41 n=1 Tax=Hohenbuehelia grisea TaxID=104357 RepID=A0ABR3JK02_9AGAR
MQSFRLTGRVPKLVFNRYRTYASQAPVQSIRERLTSDVKTAMKNKEKLTSTALRAVLSDIYAADKASNDKASESAIISILRKAFVQRNDAAAQFTKAERPDLAEKERLEANVLSKYLPPLLPEADIDRVLKDILASQVETGGNKMGQLMKAFYLQVDKSSVDPKTVKTRAEALLA